MQSKTRVVTGSSTGIGRGIGEQRWDVAVNYRSSADAAKETVDLVEEVGGSAIAVQADVTDVDEVATMRDLVHDAFGPVDVLVNNAGITQDVRFTEMSHEEWDMVLDVHLDSAFHCTQTFYDDLAEADEGRLINISSLIGKGGNFVQANYATAKASIFRFTRTLALELASMVEDVPEHIKEAIREDTPLGRLGTVEEIADIVAFLANDRSSFITGEVIDANGGKEL